MPIECRTLSVVIPCFNEATTPAECVRRVLRIAGEAALLPGQFGAYLALGAAATVVNAATFATPLHAGAANQP